MRFRNAKYALVVVGNLEKSIFTRSYINNLATLDDIVWLEGSQQYSSVGLLENVRYVKNGACKKGTLQMVQVGNDVFLIELKCFPAGTLVHTPTGTKPIEQIQTDDVVKSYDEATHTNTWQRVVGAFQKTAHQLVRIITGKDTLLATPEHPFYVREDLADGSKQGNWLAAEHLRKGFKMLLATGLLAVVDSTHAFDTLTTVYNFEVERTHTYFVGNQGVLVHNAYDIAGLINELKERYQPILSKIEATGASNFSKPKFNELLQRFQGTGVSEEILKFNKQNIKLSYQFFDAWVFLRFFSPNTTLANDIKILGYVKEIIRKGFHTEEQVVSIFRGEAAAKTQALKKIANSTTADLANVLQSIDTEILLSELIVSDKLTDAVTNGQLSANLLQKVAVWESTEPKLVEAFLNNQLNLKTMLEITLADYVLPTAANTSVANARGGLVRALNEKLGQSLTLDDFKRLTLVGGLVKQEGSRGSIFEHWVQANRGTLFSDFSSYAYKL